MVIAVDGPEDMNPAVELPNDPVERKAYLESSGLADCAQHFVSKP